MYVLLGQLVIGSRVIVHGKISGEMIEFERNRPPLCELSPQGFFVEPQKIFFLKDENLLPERKLEIFGLLIQGFQYDEIAAELGLSWDTVKNHICHDSFGIYERLRELEGSDNETIHRFGLLRVLLELDQLLIVGKSLNKAIEKVTFDEKMNQEPWQTVAALCLQGLVVDQIALKINRSSHRVKHIRTEFQVDPGNLVGLFVSYVAHAGKVPEGFESIMI